MLQDAKNKNKTNQTNKTKSELIHKDNWWLGNDSFGYLFLEAGFYFLSLHFITVKYKWWCLLKRKFCYPIFWSLFGGHLEKLRKIYKNRINNSYIFFIEIHPLFTICLIGSIILFLSLCNIYYIQSAFFLPLESKLKILYILTSKYFNMCT